MKERAITFTRPLAIAAREGRKTQTRRVVKPQPSMGNPARCVDHGLGWQYESPSGKVGVFGIAPIQCPYGKPGDRLWIRETYYQFGHWEPIAGNLTKGGKQKWGFVPDSPEIRFDAPEAFRLGRHHLDPATPAWHKRLARFMPRSASRTLLEVVSVRVERLNEIGEADAQAEGCERMELSPPFIEINGEKHGVHPMTSDYRRAFSELWQSINGPDSWSANPWVWVIEFKRVTE